MGCYSFCTMSDIRHSEEWWVGRASIIQRIDCVSIYLQSKDNNDIHPTVPDAIPGSLELFLPRESPELTSILLFAHKNTYFLLKLFVYLIISQTCVLELIRLRE